MRTLSNLHNQCFILLICFMTLCMTWGKNAHADDITSQVEVMHQGNDWALSGNRVHVSINEKTFEIKIQTSFLTWETAESTSNDLHVKNGTETFTLSFKDAKDRQIEKYQTGYMTGVKITLSEFTDSQKPQSLDIKLQVILALQGTEEDLVCEIIPEEKKTAIQYIYWPKEFKPDNFDTTIVPFMQGMLLPGNWPKAVRLYDTNSYGRGLYMPWWGHQKDNQSILLILETPEDGGCHFYHPAGGPTCMGVRWNHSLGKMDYPRRMRFCFLDNGNYVNMAKRYRRHVMERGHFVPLKEKIARTPLVQELIGAPVVHTSILYHIQPESSYYDKNNPEKNHQLTTFQDRARHLEKLAGRGVKRAYVHLDGWGFRGYDNLHPDHLPPCLEAGGWEGMKQFAETCEKLNFVFAIHDQYRDYYLDARSYDLRHTVTDQSGNRYFGNTWYGGKQSILCARLAPGYVERNYRQFQKHGIKLKGAYQDVFAVVPPEECYNPEHPMTRKECLKYRAECFNLARHFLGVVSSEEPADWAIPWLDLVHHGPYPLDPNPGKGPAMGIPVPLFNLVYHDAILLPWSLGKGVWGIPENDWGYLHAFLNAGMPYLSLEPDEESLERIRALCALNERTALLEMTSHAFLDKTWRKQRTSYADGTTVTIDLDANTYEIDPPLTQNPSAFVEK